MSERLGKGKSELISLRLIPGTYARLKNCAKKISEKSGFRVSESDVVRKAIEEYLKRGELAAK
jgi:predicted DNA-binding protein